MLCSGSLPFVLLATFLFICSTVLSSSHETSHFQPLQTTPTSGKDSEGDYDEVLPPGPTSSEPVEGSFLMLAAQRTRRKDPLNGFKLYTGGWNIDDRHYWASVGFTAAPLFLVAAIWFLGFGLCLLLLCLCHFCCKRSYGYSPMAYALSLIFLILFAIASVIGCLVLYAGQGRFHRSTTKALEYVVSQADTTAQQLRNVSDYFTAAKQIGVDQVFLPSNVQKDIDQIDTKLNSSASNLADRTVENSDDVKDLLDSVRLALLILAALMLLLTFLGFSFSIFGKQYLVYILVTIGWILVTGTLILCGIFLLLHNVTADTCVAMDQWVQSPSAHTALDDILPCLDTGTSQETLLRTKEVTSQLVEVINQVITNVSNINFSPNFPTMYFNQSGPSMPILCNPFHADLTDRICSAGEVDLNNATQVWKDYECQVSKMGICTTTGRVTPTFYDQMASVVNVSYGLYHYGPFLVQLEDCTFARQTFGRIYYDHCPGLRRYSKWVYIGLLMISMGFMFSLIFWAIYGRERRYRLRSKKFQDKSGEGLEGSRVYTKEFVGKFDEYRG